MPNINIRSKGFETNSSSSHSIFIGDNQDQIYDTIEPDKDGTIVLIEKEFSWGKEKYNDARTKAVYLYQQGYGDRLDEVITEHTGAEQVIVKGDGYIDHQSRGVGTGMDKEEIKEFIFGDSVLYIDNDNSSFTYDFYSELCSKAKQKKFVLKEGEEKVDELELYILDLDTVNTDECMFNKVGHLFLENEDLTRVPEHQIRYALSNDRYNIHINGHREKFNDISIDHENDEITFICSEYDHDKGETVNKKEVEFDFEIQ